MSDALYDVRPEQYAAVIRDMIRHEDDVTNHRIMWVLVGEGFLANAFTYLKDKQGSTDLLLALGGILVAISAFVMLYHSYQARGYLLFLGQQAKTGTLKEEHLPFVGWPSKRIKGWWRISWVCRWFRRALDLTEPWVLLPFLFIFMWMTALLKVEARTELSTTIDLILGVILSVVILFLICIGLVWSQRKSEEGTEGVADG